MSELMEVGGEKMRIPETQTAQYANLTNEQLLEKALQQKIENGMTSIYLDHYLKQCGLWNEYQSRYYDLTRSTKPHEAEFNFEKLTTFERIKISVVLSFVGVLLSFLSGYFFNQFPLTLGNVAIAFGAFVVLSAALYAISKSSENRLEGDDDE